MEIVCPQDGKRAQATESLHKRKALTWSYVPTLACVIKRTLQSDHREQLFLWVKVDATVKRDHKYKSLMCSSEFAARQKGDQDLRLSGWILRGGALGKGVTCRMEGACLKVQCWVQWLQRNEAMLCIGCSALPYTRHSTKSQFEI